MTWVAVVVLDVVVVVLGVVVVEAVGVALRLLLRVSSAIPAVRALTSASLMGTGLCLQVVGVNVGDEADSFGSVLGSVVLLVVAVGVEGDVVVVAVLVLVGCVGVANLLW